MPSPPNNYNGQNDLDQVADPFLDLNSVLS